MSDELDRAAAETLSLLEWRLRRIEFTLTGDAQLPADSSITLSQRIENLESSLRKLSSSSKAVAELLSLQAKHPKIFEDAAATKAGSAYEDADMESKLAMVLAEATSFPAAASQLNALNDLAIPPTSSFTSLAELLPKLLAMEERQLRQAREISELRKRSALAVMRWHEVFVLGQGRCWVEWDSNLTEVEKAVRREEARRAREEGEL